MKNIVLHDEAFEDLRDAAGEAGALVTYAGDGVIDDDKFSVGGMVYERYKYVPTPDEIERNRQFAESPIGKACIEMFKRSNEQFVKSLAERREDVLFAQGDEANNYQWPSGKIGTALRIRLPRDYFVKIGDEWLDK